MKETTAYPDVRDQSSGMVSLRLDAYIFLNTFVAALPKSTRPDERVSNAVEASSLLV